VQRRCEDLLDIGKEPRPVHRTVDGIGCCHQRRNAGQGLLSHVQAINKRPSDRARKT
jgi:hypothetical protein